MVKTQVYIPEEDNAELVETAKALGICKSEALRQAVHEYCRDKGRLRSRQLIQKTAGVLKENPLDAGALRDRVNKGFNV